MKNEGILKFKNQSINIQKVNSDHIMMIEECGESVRWE